MIYYFYRKALILIVVLAAVSCQPKNVVDGDLPLVDIEQIYGNPITKLSLSEVVDKVEYIKLETSLEALIGRVNSMAASSNFVVLSIQDPNRILLFSKAGNYINEIGRHGKGPGEYLAVDSKSLLISPDEKSILFSVHGRKILKYSIDGEFVNDIVLPLSSNMELNFLNNGALVVYQNRKMMESTAGHVILTLDIDLMVKDSLVYSWWDNSLNGQTYSPDLITTVDNDIYYKEFYNDSVCKISGNGEVSSEFLINLGELEIPTLKMHYMEAWSKYFMIEGLHVSDEFILLRLIGRRRVIQERNYTHELVWYNRKSKDAFMSNFWVDNDLDGINLYMTNFPRQNLFWDLLEIADGKAYIEGDSVNVDKLKTKTHYNKLEKIIEKSNMEDNPILRIFHMR